MKKTYKVFNDQEFVIELKENEIIEYGNGLAGVIYIKGKNFFTRKVKWHKRYFLLQRYKLLLWKNKLNKDGTIKSKYKILEYSCKEGMIKNIKLNNKMSEFTYFNERINYNITLGSYDNKALVYIYNTIEKYLNEYGTLSSDFKKHLVLSPKNKMEEFKRIDNRSYSAPEVLVKVNNHD